MDYHITKQITSTFEQAIKIVDEALQKEGFGILTEIDVQEKFKDKLDVDFPKYKILGACNPAYAHKALLLENKIGTMLPCNVIVQELPKGIIEISAVNPMESMKAIQNPELGAIATEITNKLNKVIESI